VHGLYVHIYIHCERVCVAHSLAECYASGQILDEGVEDLQLKLTSCVAANIISLITIMQRTHCRADVSLSLPHQRRRRIHIFGHRIASGSS
jgi:hypothetical protein